MKKITLILLGIMFGMQVLYAQHVQTFTADSTLNTDGTVTVKILTSSQCDMCKEALEKAMAFEKGVRASNLDVDTKVFAVTYQPNKTNSLKIKIAINKAGYDADDMPADERAYMHLPACCKKDGGH
jgi:mercuric ion binding protein